MALRRELGLVLLTEQDGVAEDLGAEVVQPSAQSGSPDGAHIANPKNKQWGYGLWLVGALVPLCAVSIFFSLADPSLRQIKGAETVLQLNEAEHRAELESWRMRLQRRVESQPDDSKSWYLLGHTHLKLANFVSAEQALATTYQLASDDISVKVSWLQARYLVAQGVLDERSRTLAAELLEQQPNLSIVLEILAMDAFRSGQRGEAITLLNRALSGSRDMAQQASFATAISQVRAQLEVPPPAVQVDVQASEAVPHNATIFVTARPIGGGMPYAVVKRPAVLVPFSVALDDLVSMSPNRQLSDAKDFEVSVRLSMRGVAMAEPSDWQWQSPPISQDMLVEGTTSTIQAVLSPP